MCQNKKKTRHQATLLHNPAAYLTKLNQMARQASSPIDKKYYRKNGLDLQDEFFINFA